MFDSYNASFEFTSMDMYNDISGSNFTWSDLINKSGGYTISGQKYNDLGGHNFSGDGGTFTLYQPSAVPEPSTYALLCISLGVVGYARKRMVRK